MHFFCRRLVHFLIQNRFQSRNRQKICLTIFKIEKKRYYKVSIKERRYIKSPVELCGSIILLCRTMSSR
jgi:hypothetical protein